MHSTDLELPSLLVSMPQVQDPYFAKSVVLLVEHNEEGALGFIVNRIGAVDLEEILDVEGMLVPKHLKAWFGGPLDPGSGVILAHTSDQQGTLTEGITLATTDDVLSDLLQTAKPGETYLHSRIKNQAPGPDVLYPYRFLVGYAGWDKGQLDEELRIGSWIQLAASRQLLFDTHYDHMWDLCIQSLGAQASHLAPTQQPYLN